MRVNTRYINSIKGTPPKRMPPPPSPLSVTLRRRHRCAQADDRTNIYWFETWHRSLLLCLCDVFRALINSLVCWFCTSALGLILFQTVPMRLTYMCISVSVCWDSFEIKGLYHVLNFKKICLCLSILSQFRDQKDYEIRETQLVLSYAYAHLCCRVCLKYRT